MARLTDEKAFSILPREKRNIKAERHTDAKEMEMSARQKQE